ncbi:MAG: pseudouridine synthase [Alphaproteobacteria bacterium]|nr:pseudouridine synthase [Alphaproteobacteria bacterium]
MFKNDDIVVISKPAGLPVHAGPGGGVTLDDYLGDFQFEKRLPPSLAHRLDRDTSGCLILGRNKQALRILGRLFEQGRINKTYWAILEGVLPAKQMRIDLPLAKITDKKYQWHMQADPNGQAAITELRVLDEKNGFSWVELKPKTGRTHQLRVHCAAQGTPIMGDRLYGRGDENSALMLHARALRIPYIQNDPAIIVEAPVSDAIRAMMLELGFSP